MNQNKIKMEKIKKVYYYFFYKIYKSVIYTSEKVGGEFFSDFKAGIALLTIELWFIGTFLNYYSIINNRVLKINTYSPILLIPLLFLCVINYLAFIHTDKWKEYIKKFDQMPRGKNKKGTIIVWTIIAIITINFFVSVYLLQKNVLKMY